MARIRTIKPEFPQSESIGRLSRDARLLFIQLWTIVDDDGRTRAAARMLASLLYPYDNDAADLIDGWLDELERNGAIRRYEHDGSTFLDIPKWLTHQKIDRPSASRLPPYTGPIAKPREASRELDADLGPSTKDRGPDDGGRGATVACLISPEAKELTREITVLCGHDLKFIPPAWCGAENRVHQWLAQGWPINVILASVKEQIAKKTGGPPDSVNYFEKGISRAYARYTAPIPVSDLPRGAYEITTKPGAGAVAKHIVSEFNRELEARGVDSGAYQPTHRRVQTG